MFETVKDERCKDCPMGKEECETCIVTYGKN